MGGVLNLQFFAEGAVASGSAAGDGAESAPAVQAPALRPAQERMARRSRPGSTTKANPQSPKPGEETFSPLPSADGDASRSSPEEEARNQGSTDERQSEGEEQNQSEEKKELTAAEKRRAFGKLMQGEYAAEFEEALQRASQATVQSIQNSPQVKALMDALGEAYGVDTASPDSLAALTEAVKNGRVKNDEYYETLAQEKGVSVKTAREMDRMEGELQRAAAEKQRAAAVRAQWEAEAQKLQQKYPAFELDEVMNNPAVKDMILRGVGLEAAYRAAYFNQLMENQTALTAKQVEQGVEARIRQRGQRPAGNGTHPGGDEGGRCPHDQGAAAGAGEKSAARGEDRAVKLLLSAAPTAPSGREPFTRRGQAEEKMRRFPAQSV